MPAKPNFTSARLTGGRVLVAGTTDAEPEGDILGIRVTLSQGDRVVTGDVRNLGESWNVEMPGEGFAAGPATAFGVETRRENATTTTWAQALEIP